MTRLEEIKWRYNRAVKNESEANKSVLEKFRDQNHRLKQTLSYYANPAIYDSRHGMEILRDSGDKARRELEGDESDTKEVDRRR